MKVFFYYATQYEQIKLHENGKNLGVRYLGTSTTGLSPAQDLYRITSLIYTQKYIEDNIINWPEYPGTVMTRTEAETWITTYGGEFEGSTIDLGEFDDEEDDLIDFDNVEEIHVKAEKAKLDEINTLRALHSLTQYTWPQWIAKIKTM